MKRGGRIKQPIHICRQLHVVFIRFSLYKSFFIVSNYVPSSSLLITKLAVTYKKRPKPQALEILTRDNYTLSTCDSYHYCAVTHLSFRRYSNTEYVKNKSPNRSKHSHSQYSLTPIRLAHQTKILQ